MKIIVTGGAGFIGSHLCEKLLKDRQVKKIICIDNLDPVYPVALKRANLKLLTPSKKFKFYKTDIRNLPSIEKIFKKEKPDFVVHLAAKTDTRLSLQNPFEYKEVNIRGTLNILEASKKFKVKKAVLFSSSSVYGNTSAKPPFNETVSTDFPLSPYGATKKAGEVLSYSYFYNFGLSVSCLRLFNVYGERMRQSPVLYKWVDSIFQGKPIELSSTFEIKRDFTHVSDVVEAIVKTLKKAEGFNIFNIASSNPASLNELLSAVKKVIGRDVEVIKRPSNKASIKLSHADITKAKKVLGWKPKVKLEDGVSKFVKWFKKERLRK